MDEIKAWLQGNKDYGHGLLLLQKYHPNKFLVRNFLNASPLYYAAKLEYELKKLLGIPLTEIFTQTLNTAQLIKLANPAIKEKRDPEKVIPEIIHKAKDELYRLFTAISIAHRKLFELGESNSKDVVKQRRKILDERLPLIVKYEKIYLLKEQYFQTGIIPEELSEWLLEKGTANKPANDKFSILQSLSDIELVKKAHSVKISLNKTNNRLLFQSLTKAEHPNPMPNGTLREKLEAKLTLLNEELKYINALIEKRK